MHTNHGTMGPFPLYPSCPQCKSEWEKRATSEQREKSELAKHRALVAGLREYLAEAERAEEAGEWNSYGPGGVKLVMKLTGFGEGLA